MPSPPKKLTVKRDSYILQTNDPSRMGLNYTVCVVYVNYLKRKWSWLTIVVGH